MSLKFFRSLLVFIFIPSLLFAETSHPDSYYQMLYKNAEASLDKRDVKKADFWMARFLGTASLDTKTSKGLKDLEPLLKKRDLFPRAFISGGFDAGFLDWFVKSLYPRWGAEEKRVRERQCTFEIEGAVYKNEYFATVTATPALESWFVMQNGLASRQIVLALGSAKDKPMLFFGKLHENAPSVEFQPLFLETERRALHYFWKPEFFDVDGDGVPELWLRFNLAWDNGFSQVLEVFRITPENELELLRRFRGDHGGFARRLPTGDVELGTGFASKSDPAEMSYDRDRVETWRYSKKEKKFEKVSEDVIPNILLSPAWRGLFLDSGATVTSNNFSDGKNNSGRKSGEN